MHNALGIEVEFTPPYHSQSLGGVERKHRDIKLALKTALHQLGNESGDKWLGRLPWVMLGRRTAYQPELDATAAELVMGSNPILPGDMVGEPGPPLRGKELQTLLEGLRRNAAQPAIPMSAHRVPSTNQPDLSKVTHVRVKRAKPGPLGHAYAGPFKIEERLGNSCVKIRVGSYADGRPKFEIQHWENLKPSVLGEDTVEGKRTPPGRKPLNPAAQEFKSKHHSKPVDTGQNARPNAQNNDVPSSGEERNAHKNISDGAPNGGGEKEDRSVHQQARTRKTDSYSEALKQGINTRPQRQRRPPIRYQA